MAMSDFQRAWYGGKEPQSFHVEYGLLEENRAEFEKALRRQQREEDDLYELTPGSKAFNREIKRRQAERAAKQQAQREALAAERKAEAEKQAAWNRDTFTPEVYSELTGIDLTWCRGFFRNYIANGYVAPIDKTTLTISRGDLNRMLRHNHEEIEFKLIQVANKRGLQERGK